MNQKEYDELKQRMIEVRDKENSNGDGAGFEKIMSLSIIIIFLVNIVIGFACCLVGLWVVLHFTMLLIQAIGFGFGAYGIMRIYDSFVIYFNMRKIKGEICG